MSLPASKSASAVGGVLVQKPKAGVYTALLALSLVAILIGIAFLYARLSRYEFKLKPTGLSMRIESSAPAQPGVQINRVETDFVV